MNCIKNAIQIATHKSTQLSFSFSPIYVFILQSIRHILNSTDVDKVTWYTKNSAYTSGENDPDSFANALLYTELGLKDPV